MNSNPKHIVKLVSLILLYIALGVLGVYHISSLVLFPVLALPFAVFCSKDKISINEHIFIQFIMGIGIYAVTGTWISVGVYLISICVPTYVILFFYKKELPLPNIIMYATLCLSVVVFVFLSIMKGLGNDLHAQFSEYLSEMKNIPIETIQGWLTTQTATVAMSSSEISQMSFDMKEFITNMVEMLSIFWSSLILIQVLFSTSFLIIVLNCIIRRKNKKFPSAKELLNFKLSKVAVLILFIALLAIDVNGSNEAMTILGANVMFFLMTLFQIAGLLGLIGILSKAVIGKSLKILAYVLVVILFSTVPYVIMSFGCLDAIFNYRKVEIVV